MDNRNTHERSMSVMPKNVQSEFRFFDSLRSRRRPFFLLFFAEHCGKIVALSIAVSFATLFMLDFHEKIKDGKDFDGFMKRLLTLNDFTSFSQESTGCFDRNFF